MRSPRRRASARDEDSPAAGADEALETELDKLALQITRRATAQDANGVPIEPLPLQLQALKTAGAYFALKRKHAPEDADQGSAWGNLLLNAAPLAPDDDDGDDDDEDDEDELEEEEIDG